MADLQVRQVESQQEWETFLAAHPEANFLQSWYWAEFQSRYGRTTFRSGFYDGEQLVGVMLSIVEPARRARYLTVPAGPIIDWHNQALVQAAVGEMKRIGLEEKCAFVRVRPQLLSAPETSINFLNEFGYFCR